MKLAYVGAPYPPFVVGFYAARPGLVERDFETQRLAFEDAAFGWAGAWGPALEPLGWQVQETWLDVEPMLRAWAAEHGADSRRDEADIAVAKIAAFAPDVLWYDHHDAALLERLRATCRSIRLALGWAGGELPETPMWRRFDRVLSCAPESVEALVRSGVRAELLPHAFNERVLVRLADHDRPLGLVMVGQISSEHPTHAHRARVLDRLIRELPVEIYTPSPPGPGALALAVRRGLWGVAAALRGGGVPRAWLARVPGLGRVASRPGPPHAGINATLARAARPARFGLEMYQTLRDSRVALNVHEAGATRYASNMRLFEATGVGTCLLTDAARNLSELFEPGREVAVYRSDEECVERARWLLEHDAECLAIARAGQARCLAQHTFRHRAPRLDAIIRGALG